MQDERWYDLNMILRRPSPLAGPGFQPDTEEDSGVKPTNSYSNT